MEILILKGEVSLKTENQFDCLVAERVHKMQSSHHISDALIIQPCSIYLSISTNIDEKYLIIISANLRESSTFADPHRQALKATKAACACNESNLRVYVTSADSINFHETILSLCGFFKPDNGEIAGRICELRSL